MSEKKGRKPRLIETGIEHLKVLPDSNDTILYLEGGKWYSWICIIQLTDDERDQLIEVLQQLKARKEARKEKLKKAALKPVGDPPRQVGAELIKMAQEKAGPSSPEKPDGEKGATSKNAVSNGTIPSTPAPKKKDRH